MEDLYYTAPTDEIFNEVKEKAIEIWNTYDNTFGYVDEKVGRIKDLQNREGNLMHIVSMFDSVNQAKLSYSLSPSARLAIAERFEAGGLPEMYNKFI